MRSHLRSGARRVAATMLALALASLQGCSERKEGEACSSPEDGARCLNSATALVCSEQRLVRFPCKGALGCTQNQESVRCDGTVAAEGDRCEEGSFTCSEDGKARLKCINGKYVADALCRGDDGCSVAGVVTHCDSSKAEVGEVCENVGSLACSPDGSTMLVCEGLWKAGSRCKKGCRRRGSAESGVVECEEEEAKASGPCAPDGAIACEQGGKELLKCFSGRYQKSKPCPGPTGCTSEGFSVQCD